MREKIVSWNRMAAKEDTAEKKKSLSASLFSLFEVPEAPAHSEVLSGTGEQRDRRTFSITKCCTLHAKGKQQTV